MDWLRLGDLSVGSLTTTVLLALISVYMLTLKEKSSDTWYLTGYIVVLFILLLSYTVRYSVFSCAGRFTGQFSNLIVFGIVCLVQFAYHYGGNRHPLESRIALLLFSTVATGVWVYIFFQKSVPLVYDFTAQYFTYEYGPLVSFVALAGYGWSFVVLSRNTVYRSRLALRQEPVLLQEQTKEDKSDNLNRTGWLSHFFNPAGRAAYSTHRFALLTLATAVLALMYLLFQTGVVARATYAFIFNTGSLLICLLIFIVYVNNAAQPTSFRTKLVGVPLATIMVTFGIVATSLAPLLNSFLSDRFQRDLELVEVALQITDLRDLKELDGEVVFITPASDDPAPNAYFHDSVPERYRSRVADFSEVNELSQEGKLEEARFFYLDLMDTSSFFFYYERSLNGRVFRVGFPYAAYRHAIHALWSKLALIVLGTAVFVVFGFPLVYRRGLLKPLSDLHEAVRQVETGNYGLALPVSTGDEVGQLALAYNRMVLALRNAEGNFKALAENANDAILLLSQGGSVIYANTRAAEISGYSPEELRRKSFHDFIPSEDRREVEKRFSERMNGGPSPRCYESRIVDKSGRIVPIEITGARTVWQDAPADVVIIRDISERKESEELLRLQQQQLLRADKLASLGALVASMAHEVNNPNQVISMDARFLSDGMAGLFSLAETAEEADESVRIAGVAYPEFKESARSAVSEIRDSAARIAHIVADLKRFAGGGTQNDAGPTDVNQVIRTVVRLSRHFIDRATKRFKLVLNPELPQVKADRIGIEQVVLNLLQNACQSLSDTGRGVTVRSNYDEDAQAVRIEISDEGDGIARDQMDRITDPFYSTRRESGGTGLGLYVSSRIIREHEGSLTFTSEAGVGTTVLVSLPAEVPDRIE